MTDSDVRARLGGIDLRISGEQPAPGTWGLYLLPGGLDGWTARTQDGSEVAGHWSGQGQTVGAARSEARQITIRCLLLGSAVRGLGSVSDGIEALSRLSRTTLVVAESSLGLVRCADVRVVEIQPPSRLGGLSANVTLSLTADDPLRYSAESRPLTNGTVLLPNRGDATAFGRLTLTAPHGAISIVHPGGTWTFPALASGSRLVDFRELRVWNAATGARVFGEGAGPVPRVLPGGSSWTVSGLGAGTAVLSRAEAWS